MQHTKKDLMKDFEKLGLKPTDKVLVHSSYKAVGNVDGGAETVLDAFIEYMSDGLLIFPTHTWASVKPENPVFNVQTEPPCVGILPTLFLKRQGVSRSLHPTHSVAALGKGSGEYLAGEEKAHTPCPRTGCWGRLYDIDAKILFLGEVIIKNTFLHSVEEWNKIPGRLTENEVPFKVIDGDKSYDVPCKRHVEYDYSQHYIKMREPFIAKGICTKGKIGDAVSYLCSARGMADLTSEYLKKNSDIFANDEAVPTEWYT